MNAVHTTTGRPSRGADILRFWHRLELFAPFDLRRQVLDVDDAAWSVWRLSAHDLAGKGLRDMWRVDDVPRGHRLGGFDAYVGVFDKGRLKEEMQRLGLPPIHAHRAFDDAERGALEGPTCFARIRLDAQGVPLFDEVSVSTLPWALGRVRAQGLKALDGEVFNASLATLKTALNGFRQRRPQATEGAAAPSGQPPMSPSEWAPLLEIFEAWAGYRAEPVDAKATILVLRAKSVLQSDPANLAHGDGEPPDQRIGILNSTSLRDIERAIRSLRQGDAPSALDAYLTPAESRLDLYEPRGRAHILAALQPAPGQGRGRWPSDSPQATGLMQQFAIDSILDRLAKQGIASVNAPPGTGRTSLMRELIADNLTRRARVLARMAAADEAFLPSSIEARFVEGKSWRIRPLREELAGFEMVIASSNDSAAADLSDELLKSRSLGAPEWRDAQGEARIGYLQTVAHKRAAKTSSGDFADLPSPDVPWALISQALGQPGDCRAFIDGLCTVPGRTSDREWPKGYDSRRHQTLWEWARQYTGPDFATAASSVRHADAVLTDRIVLLSRYAQVSTEIDSHSLAEFCAGPTAREAQAREALDEAREVLRQQDDSIDFCEAQWQSLRAEAESIEKSRPAWWRRLINDASAVRYREHSASNAQLQSQLGQRKRREEAARLATQQKVERAVLAHHKAQQASKDRAAEWDEKLRERAALAALFPQAAAPHQPDRLDDDEWQVNGLWRDESVDRLRTELFVASLDLHQAWLAEVLRGPLCETVFAFRPLLEGRPLIGAPEETRAAALAIWRSLFMIVPVLTCSLSSVERQLRELDSGSIGWLFVDNAAQATPQAAVGALWRARRAVVLGDLLQAEPAFEVPVALVEAITETSDLPVDREVSPHRVSAQHIADAASAIGARMGPADAWIGSPLRVQWHAADPMFTLANQVAYHGRLISGRPGDASTRPPPPGSLDLGPSAWVDVKGPARAGTVVEAQIVLVFNALVALTARCNGLPPLSIVSPFRHIRLELLKAIKQRDKWPAALRSGSQPIVQADALNAWCRQHIGTVHSTQGRRDSIVWMVLGCDDKSAAAASWASEKPHPLNAALTQARHRLFLIGDRQLWRRMPHFDVAEASLPAISEAEFVARASAPPADAAPKTKPAEALAARR